MMEPNDSFGTERHPHGEVRVEVVDEHILAMTVDRVEKKNAFTPKIINELSAALTRHDDDPDLFVCVLAFAGRIIEFRVMVRPLQALNTVHRTMGAELDTLGKHP